MIDYEARLTEAKSVHAAGEERVKTTPEPEGQKFSCGSRVKIDDDLGMHMPSHPSGLMATVVHVYCHAYGGNDCEKYCLDVDEQGQVAWYYESQLTLIEGSV